jgi:hypothetical protein
MRVFFLGMHACSCLPTLFSFVYIYASSAHFLSFVFFSFLDRVLRKPHPACKHRNPPGLDSGSMIPKFERPGDIVCMYRLFLGQNERQLFPCASESSEPSSYATVPAAASMLIVRGAALVLFSNRSTDHRIIKARRN